jgi:hypothetical protein
MLLCIILLIIECQRLKPFKVTGRKLSSRMFSIVISNGRGYGFRVTVIDGGTPNVTATESNLS